MGRLLRGWREWALTVLSISDCLFTSSLLQLSTFFILEYLENLIFRYLMPSIVLLHYLLDGFRWQMYPLYVQFFCVLFSNNYGAAIISNDVRTPTTTTTSTTHSLFSSYREVTDLISSSSPVSSSFSSLLPLKDLINTNHPSHSGWRIMFHMTQIVSYFKMPLAVVSFFMCWVCPIPTFPEPDGNWGSAVEEFQFMTTSAHQNFQFPEDLKVVSDREIKLNQSAYYIDASSPSTQRSNTSAQKLPKIISQQQHRPPRPFQVLVFYPIEKHRHKSESRYQWLPLGKRTATGFSRMLNLPAFLFRHLLQLATQSIILAPLSKKRRKYPIVFLSHGLGMTKTSHSMLCQTLASHGYIVVAIEHTDGSAVVTTSTTSPPIWFSGSISLQNLSVMPPQAVMKRQGTIALRDIHAESSSVSKDADNQIKKDFQALADLIHDDRKNLNDMGSETWTPLKDYRHQQLRMRVAEIRAAHDTVKQFSNTSGSWLKDRIDWDTSNIIGYGFGASSAILSCIVDEIDRIIINPQNVGPAFKSCTLLSPWLDPIAESELKLTEWTNALNWVGNPIKLPQNFLIISTNEIINQELTKQLRLIKLLKESTAGGSTILQFSRCKRLDLTDYPILAPKIFRFFDLSGPREPSRSARMAIRVVCNFLSHNYRRSLFTVSVGRAEGGKGLRRRPKQSTAVGRHLLSGGSESETGLLSVGSVSDASSSTAPGRPGQMTRKAALKGRYGPSVIHALRLAGIPDHYVRGLGGLRSTSLGKGLGRLLIPDVPKQQTDEIYYDVLEGVTEYVDDSDYPKGKPPNASSDLGCSFADICHI